MSWILANMGMLLAVSTVLGTVGNRMEASSKPWVAKVGNVLAGAGVDALSVLKGVGLISGGKTS